jgi:osmotically-inducible protein OsmY
MITDTERRRGVPLRRRTARVDAVLEEQLRQQFRASPYRELARTMCRFQRGTAILEGEVSTFYLKQLAQTIARRQLGVHTVVNHITVRIFDDPQHARRRNLLVDVE